MTWSFAKRRRATALGWSLLLALAVPGWGHAPLPPSVTDPKTPAEAWNVIRLATANVRRLLAEGRLAEAPDQIALCSPALRELAKAAADSPNEGPLVAAGTVRAGVAVISFAQASGAGDRATADRAFESFQAETARLASHYDAATVQADIYACPMHPDCLSVDPNAHCPKCGMGLLLRRIPYSFVYVPPGEPTIRLTVTAQGPPVAGQPLKAIARLSRHDGSPVLPSDLLVMHTQPIHLLIIDPALEDYHHEHPTPTDVPGEYAFSFTPAKSVSYRIFADLTPADTAVQEYTFCDLPAPGAAAWAPAVTNRQTALSSSAGGLQFHLELGGTAALATPARAGEARALTVTVSDSTGAPVTALQPVMNAFAHLVGFYEDGRTVVHLHPFGPEVVDANARGGPALEFKFFPPKAGFVRLFCQVEVNGQMLFAPFGLDIQP